MNQFNFSPLTNPKVTWQELKFYAGKSNMIMASIASVVVFGVLAFMSFSIGLGRSITFTQLLIAGSMPIMVAIVVLAMIWYVIYRDARRKVLLKHFADQNGLEFTYSIPNPAYPGMYFQVGDSQQLSECIRTKDGVEIGHYHYETGSGRSRRTHDLGYARFKLTRRLPHIVLDSKKNNPLGFSNLPETFSRDQKLSLEGDFDKHYTLYAPKEYERDVLYIFPPNVMQVFIDAQKAVDIEIIDNELYIYSMQLSDITKPETFRQLMDLVELLGQKVERSSDRYSDERIGQFSANIVAQPGQRLKTSVSIVTIIVIAYFILNIVLNIFSVSR